MDKQEQVAFVTTLTNNIRDEVIGLINEGKVPEDWDGHQLRMLLSEKFEASARMSRLHHGNRGNYDPKAKRKYDNDVIVNNL